ARLRAAPPCRHRSRHGVAAGPDRRPAAGVRRPGRRPAGGLAPVRPESSLTRRQRFFTAFPRHRRPRGRRDALFWRHGQPPDIPAMISTPLFPLSRALYPEGILHLRIFEIRYLDMIKQCIAEQSEFGVVPLLAGNEVRTPEGKEVLADFGTMAKIEQWQAP